MDKIKESNLLQEKLRKITMTPQKEQLSRDILYSQFNNRPNYEPNRSGKGRQSIMRREENRIQEQEDQDTDRRNRGAEESEERQ